MILKYAIRNLLLFGVTFLIQVAVLDNVQVYGLGFPMIYFMVVLFLPIRQPAYVVLPLAFLAGLSMDFFANTGGLHAGATTLLGFARFFVLNGLEPQAGYEKEDIPGVYRFRATWMVSFLLILVTLHHLFYFILEEGNLLHIGEILLKTIVSAVLSIILILLFNLFLFRR